MPGLPKKLETLKVTAFTDEKRQGKGTSFTFKVKPGKMGSRHENRFSKLRGINVSGRSAVYAYSPSDNLSLQLILDNTLSDEFLFKPIASAETDVEKRVQDFLALCYYMDGDIHQPAFLIVEWGETMFECRLKSVEVAYTLYDDKGQARRAELNTVFVADMAKDKRVLLESKKSPDITHERIFKQGDTLPLMAKEIYGDAGQYLRVAKHNGLDHFRNIEPGTKLQFPPLQTDQE